MGRPAGNQGPMGLLTLHAEGLGPRPRWNLDEDPGRPYPFLVFSNQ